MGPFRVQCVCNDSGSTKKEKWYVGIKKIKSRLLDHDARQIEAFLMGFVGLHE